MKFDTREWVETLEKFSPVTARQLVMKYIGLVSPFNGHLKSTLENWTPLETVIEVRKHRKIKNHLGGIHAGALFTLGESCAGLLLLRSLDIQVFRLILKSVSVEYFKQARDSIQGVCQWESSELVQFQKNLNKDEEFFTDLKTEIKNKAGESLCLVKTQWQIKPWALVNTSSRK